jgi:hypothetical protein
MSIVIASLFITALLSVNPLLVSASTPTSQSPSTMTAEEQQQPKPGIIMIITFENGTTKAISSDSTNIRTVQGGYFIADPSVSAAKPLQPKTVSNTVVQQLVSILVDIQIENDPVAPTPTPPISSKGCGEGWGYYVDDPNPICEPIDKIGQGPPPDQAFCAALGCPYNPPAESELPPAQQPSPSPVKCEPGYMPLDGDCVIDPMPRTITSPPPVEEEEQQPEPQPEPAPDPGNEDQNEEQDTQNNEEESGGSEGGGSEVGGSDGGEDEEG